MLVIGSRGSKLALWQARWVAARLEETGWRCRIQTIRTTGDTVKDLALSKVGAKGLFTKQIEEALLEERIDLAVHSLKDLPTETPRGLVIGAVPAREDARDAMVGRKLAELPAGARVGTSSLRRAAQVRLLRRDLVVESIRGNLDTRLRKLDDGLYDAIVVAAAGLKRLGWEHRIAELLPVEQVCPAAGQGALAVEIRDEEGEARQACGELDDTATRAAVTAERAVLAALGGGCQVPVGAHAAPADGALELQAVVLSPDGARVVRARRRGPMMAAEELGRALGEELLSSGAGEILETVYGA